MKTAAGRSLASEASMQESPTAAEVHQEQLESAVHLDSEVEASQLLALRALGSVQVKTAAGRSLASEASMQEFPTAADSHQAQLAEEQELSEVMSSHLEALLARPL